MFDLTYLQNILTFLSQYPFGVQVLCILCAYVVAPLCGIPMMALTYATALIFGLKGGVLAFIGYGLSLTLLFEGASLFKENKRIKKPLLKLQKRFPKLSQDLPFVVIVGLAAIVPYLPLVTLLGMTQKKRLVTYSALILGSLPAFFIALQAGVLGKGLIMGMSHNRFIFSLVTLALALMLHLWIFKKAQKNIKQP